MKKITVKDIPPHGMPLYEMRDIFEFSGKFSKVSMNFVSILPGNRVPTNGFSCHQQDEYAYTISGELETFSGGEYSTDYVGEASFIPRGEEHFCINKKDTPCQIVCFMVE